MSYFKWIWFWIKKKQTKKRSSFLSSFDCFSVLGFMRVCASVKLWQRQSVSNSVFHLWNIKQVGRDERLLNSEKYTLIYYLQPFQWCLCSVLKKQKEREKKNPRVCLSRMVDMFCFLFRDLGVILNTLRCCHYLFFMSFWHVCPCFV